MVPADHDDGHEHVAGYQEGGKTGQQAQQYEDASKKLGEGGDVSQPVRQTEGSDEMTVAVKRGEGVAAVEASGGNDLVVTVVDHGTAKHEAQKESTPGLQVVQ